MSWLTINRSQKPSGRSPFRINLFYVVVSLMILAWFSLVLYEHIGELVTTFADATTAEATKKAGFSLITHIVSGSNLIGPIIAGLIVIAIKLLDEKPAEETVPAAVLKMQIEANERQTQAFERMLSVAMTGSIEEGKKVSSMVHRLDNVTKELQPSETE